MTSSAVGQLTHRTPVYFSTMAHCLVGMSFRLTSHSPVMPLGMMYSFCSILSHEVASDKSAMSKV